MGLIAVEVYVSLVSVQWTWHQKFSIACTNWKATETSTTMTSTDTVPTHAQTRITNRVYFKNIVFLYLTR